MNTVYTSALKTVTSRTRPDGSDTLSFPAGHTSTAFAWATVANAHYGWKVGVPSYFAAGAIGLSRVATVRLLGHEIDKKLEVARGESR